jgi:hypothetical protein
MSGANLGSEACIYQLLLHRLASVNGWGIQSSSRNAIPSRFTVSNWLAFRIGQPFLQWSLKAPAASRMSSEITLGLCAWRFSK